MDDSTLISESGEAASTLITSETDFGISNNVEWFSYRLFEHIERQIERADAKAGFIIAADAVLLVGAAGMVGRAWATILSKTPSILGRVTSICILVAVLLLVISFVISLFVVRPRLLRTNKISLAYFDGIRRLKEDEFVDKFIAQSPAEVKEAILREVHAKARIASTKYIAVAWSISLLGIALAFWGCTYVIDAFL